MELRHEIEFVAQVPAAMSQKDIYEFASLVSLGGEVNVASLLPLIAEAKIIAFAKESGKIIATSALKVPNQSYRLRIFSYPQCGNFSTQKYLSELGWLFTTPEFRGQGIAAHLIKTILQKVYEPIYATSRSDNASMHKLLQSNGFEKQGTPYPSRVGETHIQLFLRTGDLSGSSDYS